MAFFSALRSQKSLDPLQVSAQYVAFTWFLEQNGRQVQVEAAHFAKDNWRQFLPAAHEGMGKLLIRITTPRNTTARRIRKLVRQRRLTLISGPN